MIIKVKMHNSLDENETLKNQLKEEELLKK